MTDTTTHTSTDIIREGINTFMQNRGGTPAAQAHGVRSLRCASILSGIPDATLQLSGPDERETVWWSTQRKQYILAARGHLTFLSVDEAGPVIARIHTELRAANPNREER